VAEGIGMALQGAVLLADTLATWRQAGARREALAGVATAYAREWRRRFAPRIRASAAIARWAMSPWLGVTLPFVRAWPGVLTWGARCAGKATDGIQRPRPLPLGA
jgi:flavin-dependent dehydrogenase